MDSRGNIIQADIVAALESAAKEGDKKAAAKLATLVPIEAGELSAVQGMNHAQRRAWYSNKRRTRKRFGGAR